MEIEKRLLHKTTLGMMNGGQMLQNAGEKPDKGEDKAPDPATQTVASSEPTAASSDPVSKEEIPHLEAARDAMGKFLKQPVAVKDAIKSGVNTVINGAIDQTRKGIGAIPFVGGLLGDAWDTLGAAKEVGKGTLTAVTTATVETIKWPFRPVQAGYHFARFLAEKAISKIRK